VACLRDAEEQEASVVANTNVVVQSTRLDPNYEISLFPDVPIPPGAAFHEIKNGKIIHS
jgi:hypothetical protein